MKKDSEKTAIGKRDEGLMGRTFTDITRSRRGEFEKL